MALQKSWYKSRFQTREAETRTRGPVSCPGGWHLLCASPAPASAPARLSVTPGANEPPEFADCGCRGPGGCSPHWGLPGLRGSGSTGVGMLLIQHCALKNRFGDKRPLGWAARRGPGSPGRLASPLADCGQAPWVECLRSRQHGPACPNQKPECWDTTAGRRQPGNRLVGTHPSDTCPTSSILGFPLSMAW